MTINTQLMDLRIQESVINQMFVLIDGAGVNVLGGAVPLELNKMFGGPSRVLPLKFMFLCTRFTPVLLIRDAPYAINNWNWPRGGIHQSFVV